MNIHVISETENKLFDRKEIVCSVTLDDRTLSNEEAKREICKKMNLKPDATIITGIEQSFGIKHCTVYAHAYAKSSDIEKFEKKHILARLKKSSEKAAKKDTAEKPKEEKKE